MNSIQDATVSATTDVASERTEVVGNAERVRAPDLLYHPDPLDRSGRRHGLRNVSGRLAVIQRNVSIDGKTVLDLGCSGGYFSFALASRAHSVLAVDADANLLEHNRRRAAVRGIRNVSFVAMYIDPGSLRSSQVPRADVTLFLSVLHHLIIPTDAYAYAASEDRGTSHAVDVLRAVREKTETLCFEMGQSNEQLPWARFLPDMGARPDDWIVDKLLKPAGFSQVTIMRSPEWIGAAGCLCRVLYRMEPLRGKVRRAAAKVLRYDNRDCRYLFIAR